MKFKSINELVDILHIVFIWLNNTLNKTLGHY
jgi:hypothetical protein